MTSKDVVNTAVAVRRGERDLDSITDATTREAVRRTARQLTTADLHVLSHQRIAQGRMGRSIPIRSATR